MNDAPAISTATDRIRQLNDDLRRTFSGGGIVQTRGIRALPPHERHAIQNEVRRYDAFNQDNDPYGEHDSGQFDHRGRTILWKIDYYDPSETWLSQDPANPHKTRRVLTIMLAEEY
jgi:hypothetical protein